MNTVFSCAVCGQRLGLAWVVDHFGEPICDRCISTPRCLGCDAHTGGAGERAQTVLSGSRVRCRRCSRGAVDAHADIGPVVAVVRPLLQSFGIRLVNRIRVELVSPADLRDQAGENLHGLTLIRPGGITPAQVLALRIVDGLPATLFGSVLAHEMGHAWLAGCPQGERDKPTEEGLCELVASWWLHHRGGRLSAHLLSKMGTNPDPVYGAGFRDARKRTEGHSPAEVVSRVQRFGRL